ncbi:hypothetical protein D9611_003742 [Ephemerocybe angulata]|uniref:Uncharacterized protein n=1 Tax=Ephemerocybe angulata TaxID=980116 RepID=A0A8H5B5B0_9AGAR|nr:hypothetical protein D9611_003742 [Tulosesus angulatus]
MNCIATEILIEREALGLSLEPTPVKIEEKREQQLAELAQSAISGRQPSS